MKITVGKLELLKELEKCLLVVERKTTIPILSNFLFTAQGTRLWVSGTDLDISLVRGLEAKVQTEGSTTIPARKLLDCLKNLKTVDCKEVTITELDNHWASLTCGPLLVKIPGMASTNYPTLNPFPDESVNPAVGVIPIVVPSDVIAGLISRSMYAISHEESRYTLNGALLVIGPEMIRMVTTDGHRLAYVQHAGQFTVQGEHRTLVSRRALGILQDLLGTGPVVIAKDDSTIFFRSGNWTMRSRVLTGQFPNYEAVIPKSTRNEAVIVGKDLKASITRVVQFADERSMALRFRFNNTGLTLMASSTEAGEAQEHVKSHYTGSPVDIGFNAGFVLDVLATLGKDDAIVIKTTDAHSTGMFIPFPQNGFQSQNVIMPMRI